MQAMIYTAPNRIELHDVPAPRPGAGSQRLRVDAVGLCGSDLHTAIAALAQGRFGDLAWVEERTLSQGPAAFGDMVEGRVAAAKIVLRPGA